MVVRGVVLILCLGAMAHLGCSVPVAVRNESPSQIQSLAAVMANMENEMNNIYRNINSIQEFPEAEESVSRLLSLEHQSLMRLVNRGDKYSEHSSMTSALESAIAQTERLLSSIQARDLEKATSNLEALDTIRRHCHSMID